MFESHLDEAISAVDSAFQRAAEIIGGSAETYAKQLCRADTGNLRNSITHKTETDGGSTTVVVGTNVSYAP